MTKKHPHLALSAVIVLLALLPTARSFSQERPVYQPAGAPANPKVAAHWNRYHDYAQTTELLQQLAQAHPKLCRLTSVGKSHGGREMWVVTVTNQDQGQEPEKPAFWIDGGIHANELQCTEVVLYTTWYLLESYGRNPFITRLLDERCFYLAPIMSPDSRDAHMYRPNSTHSPRTGQRPFDDDRDGLIDEDGPDDLDGDGQITQMRIRDPNGRWKPHPEHPQLMIRAGDEERGQFTLLGQEGIDNDGDGKINEDGDGNYDPNRDWAWNWQPKHVQNGAHRYPFSILENRMIADFVAAHPNIAGGQSYHNAAGMILRGPGGKDDRYDDADIAVLNTIGKKGELLLPGYKYVNVVEGLYEAFGGEFDWFYSMQGVFCYTNELFTGFNYFRKPSESGFFGKEEDMQLFNKYLLFDAGVAPWREVDHPVYGKVEVGGFTKNWVRQPPSFLLEEECHRNMAFTLYHADQMPQVKVDAVTAAPQPDGTTLITATIVNQRLTPTHSQADVKNKITPPDLVTLAGPHVKVIAGLTSTDPLFRRPVEQPRRPERIRLATVRGLEAAYVRWIVTGKGPYTVTVRSVKGGVDSKAVN